MIDRLLSWLQRKEGNLQVHSLENRKVAEEPNPHSLGYLGQYLE